MPSLDTCAVVMCGISGSGKTVYSQRLEKQGYTRISADESVWQKYGDSFTELSPQCQREVYMTINAEVIATAKEALSHGQRIVVDATMCKRATRDKMVSACREAGVEPVFVYLPTPYEVLAQRLACRTGHGPNDQLVTEEQLRKYFANFEVPADDENFIIPDECR